MKRHLNWTGRRSIPESMLVVRINEPAAGDTTPTFDLQIGDLTDLQLPGDAKIYVEPYVAQSSMRFDFGTVSARIMPEDRRLTELDAGGTILFRLKVVDETIGTGRILALAREVAARFQSDDEGKKPILPVKQTDLDEQLWRLNITSEGPELCVSSKVPDLLDRLRLDPLVQGAIVPAAVREVLQAMFEPEEEHSWMEEWRLFASTLWGETLDWEITDPDEISDLIDGLVRAFTRKHRYASRAGAIND